jgi:hypothetical protein
MNAKAGSARGKPYAANSTEGFFGGKRGFYRGELRRYRLAPIERYFAAQFFPSVLSQT